MDGLDLLDFCRRFYCHENTLDCVSNTILTGLRAAGRSPSPPATREGEREGEKNRVKGGRGSFVGKNYFVPWGNKFSRCQ